MPDVGKKMKLSDNLSFKAVLNQTGPNVFKAATTFN
jgi:hypothetical protein